MSEFPFQEGGLIHEAYKWAVMAHEGQFRKGVHEPFVQHPLRVAVLVFPHVSAAGVAAALLHDVLEDTDHGIEQFPLRVEQLVDLLTVKDYENKSRMVDRICASRDREGLLIKLADRIDNLSDGVKTFDSEWVQRYVKNTVRLLKGTFEDCHEHELWNHLLSVVVSVDPKAARTLRIASLEEK